MAFWGGEDYDEEPPQFKSSKCPFLQLGALYLCFASGKALKFITYMSDDTWGIMLTSELSVHEIELDEGARDRIYRTRKLAELPLGEIESIEVFQEPDKAVSEISISISGKELLMVSGEVSSPIDIVKGDESILLFLEPELISTVKWRI